jgi:hypothetical protein
MLHGHSVCYLALHFKRENRPRQRVSPRLPGWDLFGQSHPGNFYFEIAQRSRQSAVYRGWSVLSYSSKPKPGKGHRKAVSWWLYLTSAGSHLGHSLQEPYDSRFYRDGGFAVRLLSPP